MNTQNMYLAKADAAKSMTQYNLMILTVKQKRVIFHFNCKTQNM